MNPIYLTDFYKTSHHAMYSSCTEYIYSNFTPRNCKYSPTKSTKVVAFGARGLMKRLKKMFDKNFFSKPLAEVVADYKETLGTALGGDLDYSHIEALHKLGYLPLRVKALKEGTLVPMGVPLLTITNTIPEFFWLVNYLETLFSNELWHPMTTATTAYAYRKLMDAYCAETDPENAGFVDWQGHDFSSRGMCGMEAASASGAGHLLSFRGTDSLSAIPWLKEYYGAKGFIGGSVVASEHSVMCNNIADCEAAFEAGKAWRGIRLRAVPSSSIQLSAEIATCDHLMTLFPEGILSVVQDSYDFWGMITEGLPVLKDQIMERKGKYVVRPDSGIPEDILCGVVTRLTDGRDIREAICYYGMDNCTSYKHEQVFLYEGNYYEAAFYMEREYDGTLHPVITHCEEITPTAEQKGLIECLWDTFGGTVNEQGYKVLDQHIGAIYGDSITFERANTILKRLKEKGFASTNCVLGIGSYTYQYVTRDTYGFAMKATWSQVDGEARILQKKPKTDPGKKSAAGFLQVHEVDGELVLKDRCETPKGGLLRTIFHDGDFFDEQTFEEIRECLSGQ